MTYSCILLVSFCIISTAWGQVDMQQLHMKIHTDIEFQEIDGFGASDAWRCQFVGAHWPKNKKEGIATLLFSQETDAQGKPKGIGLSIWRFYIGAGTAEQGDVSDIKNPWRRAESFIDKEGNYDWTKQKGQQWFLKKAKDFGVEKLLAFSIAAPVFWTINKKGYAPAGNGTINLQPDKYNNYADFLVTVLEHFKSEDLYFDYISPINEPQWDWEKTTQEGTPATNKNIYQLTNLIHSKIDERGLSTQIVLSEAASLKWLYQSYGNPERGDQITAFFNPSSPYHLSDKENVARIVSGHSYFTTWPVDSLIRIRQQLHHKLNQEQLGFWQSEFCILETTQDIGSGRNRDLGMNTALYVARVIHADLTLAQARSWQWWTALTIADYKDGLIYLDTGISDNLYDKTPLKYNGEYHDSKLLWAFGNYSRFIRPGMKRIKITTNTQKPLQQQYENVMISAYSEKQTAKLVVVAINYGNHTIYINHNNSKIHFNTMYITSKNKNLEPLTISNNNTIALEPRSVCTLIGQVFD